MFVVSFFLPLCSPETVQVLTQFENTFILSMNYSSNTGPKTLRLKYDHSSLLQPIDGADVTQNHDLPRLLPEKKTLHIQNTYQNITQQHE